MRGVPRAVRLALVLLASLALFVARNHATDKPDSAPLKIGLLMDSLKVERWQTDLDVFQKRAKELGADYLFWGPLEETNYPNSGKQWEQTCRLVGEGAWGRLYDLRQK